MNTRTIIERRARRVFRTTSLASLALILALGVVACSDPLNVENQQDLLDQDLNDERAVGPIIRGVAGDYAVAYMNAVLLTGLYSSELIHTGSFPSWREFEKGIGTRPSASGNQMYNNVARAVFVADDAVDRFREIFSDADQRSETAEALVWGGLARFVYADNYCEATFNSGPPLPPQQIYADAEAKFTEAISIATAAGDNDLVQRAYAARARARLMQADFTGARDDALEVPAGFVFLVLYSTNSAREENDVATLTRTDTRREAGVHPRFYDSQGYIDDPRTVFIDRGPNETGPDPTRKYVEQEKYPTEDAPIPASSWEEVRLIEAEAELELGNLTRAVELIDAVRASSGLGTYTGAVTEQAVRDQLMFERSAELWLQAQHMVDLKRTNDPYYDTRVDRCVEIGQDEFDTNANLGAGG